MNDAWRSEAVCSQTDPEIFFPESGGGLRDATKAAVEICVQCPVRLKCLKYAVDNNEEHGIWGGLNPLQRLELKRGRRNTDVSMPWKHCRHGHEMTDENTRYVQGGTKKVCRACDEERKKRSVIALRAKREAQRVAS